MRRTNKVFTTLLMTLCINSTIAFAAMPDATVVIRDNAYSLEYAENTSNRREILEQLQRLGEGQGKVE